MIDFVPYIIYALFAVWTFFSLKWILKLQSSKDVQSINPYLYESIPSVYTTIGVFGTFVGIYLGLLDFRVAEIDSSISGLLEGLKTAFGTSIIGIFLSLLFSKISKSIYGNVEKLQPELPSSEMSALKTLIDAVEKGNEISNKNFKNLEIALIGENETSVTSQLVKLRNQQTDQLKALNQQAEFSYKIWFSLGGDTDLSLNNQLSSLRVDINEHAQKNSKNIDWIVKSMNSNNKVIEAKFKEFSELLAKNNTEALVEVMKKATEEFNNQMSALINKLVQENFAELNNSVQTLNQWQKDNKEMIAKLTEQFKSVSNDFTISSSALKEVSINTSTLTDKNSQLVQIVDSLKKVMVDDTKFTQITDKVSGAVDTLKLNIEAFDKTTNELNQWVKKQRDFSDSVTKLLVRLEEIDKIKDINEVFWKNLKAQLNDGVSIIEKSIKDLDSQVGQIHGHFYEKLNDTFQNLDTLIQRIVAQYNK
jgi:hypothetical protein